jgi:hypothetical protein
MYIVGFNGPPRSGKDTMAAMLADHMDQQGCTIPVRLVHLSSPLRHIAYSMVNWPCSADGDGFEGENYAEFKSTRFELFGGRTGRQLMIDVSESFLKPVYGPDVMAWILMNSLRNFSGLALVTDTGFQIEADYIAAQAGLANFYAVQIHRDGATFEDDSREWVRNPGGGIAMHPNNGSLDDLRTEAGGLYSRLVNQMGWKL